MSRRSQAAALVVCSTITTALATAQQPQSPQLETPRLETPKQEARPLEERVRSRLEAMPPTRPRLFLRDEDLPALRRKLDSNPVLRDARDALLATAEVILAAPPAERQQTGRRLLSVSRTVLKRVTFTGLAWRLTGDERFAERALAEMRAAASFRDWNPSHFLDVAEMTAALAIGFDWCQDYLSETAREQIATAILDLGLRPSLAGGWWVRTTNNWNQVCHAGLSLGALVTSDRDPETAVTVLTRAVENLPRAMHEYAPHGAYPEGPGYWVYGTSYNAVGLDALAGTLGTDFGLSTAPGFRESPWYYLHVTGPTGQFFNYSDCGTRGRVATPMYWFARELSAPDLLQHELDLLAEFAAEKPSSGRSHRLLPLALIWCPELGGQLDAPADTLWHGQGTTPVALMRSSWTNDATFVGFKAGTASANHAHMDAGSFVLDALGTRWAEDLGSQSYHSLESKGIRLWNRSQDSQRWDVFRLGTSAHNVLMVQGAQQRVDGIARLVEARREGDRQHAIADLSTVYAGQLANAQRGIELLPSGAVHVQDEIVALAGSEPTEVRWAMLTRATALVEAPGRVRLERDGQVRILTVASPAETQLEVQDTSEPVESWDAANPGTRTVVFRHAIAPGSRATLSVQIGAADDAPPASRPLSDW